MCPKQVIKDHSLFINLLNRYVKDQGKKFQKVDDNQNLLYVAYKRFMQICLT